MNFQQKYKITEKFKKIYIKMPNLIANERYRRILPSLYEYFRSSFR